LFLIKINILLALRNNKKNMNSDIFSLFFSPLFSFFLRFFFPPPFRSHCNWLFIAKTSKSPPICFEEKNGSPAFGAPAPLTNYFILFYFYFLLCIIIYIYIGKIKNSIQY